MQKILMLVVKNGIKYQFGIDKSVAETINEINACQGEFYQVHENCAIKKEEIVSVEQFQYELKEG